VRYPHGELVPLSCGEVGQQVAVTKSAAAFDSEPRLPREPTSMVMSLMR